jgi:hypothetical protein
MRSVIAKLGLAAALLAGPLPGPCDGQVTLSWSSSPSPAAAGYYLCWGTASGVYSATNAYTVNQTSGTITNLVPNQEYFFAVQAFASNGTVSPFSNVARFTNGPPATNVASSPPPLTNTTSQFVTVSNSAGPPVLPGINNPSQVNNGGGSSSVVSGNGGVSGSNSAASNSAANFLGVPPQLIMLVSNGLPKLNISGTVGATMTIQTMANSDSLDRWDTMTNVTLTNIAPVAQDNPASQAQDMLDVAFVPALQALPINPSNSTPFQLFRAVMPYDYAILASIVLKGQGYTPRLIVVNMPGIVCDDVCYVNEAASYIHYNWTNAVLQLRASRPSIRQIANTLANSLSLDWTTASEFTYSNGLGQILATVVETEPPSSDPVAGQNPPSQPMVIDF